MTLQAVTDANKTAIDLIARRKYVGAELVLRRALQLATAPELWCNLSVALWNQRRPKEALEAVEEALRMRPDYWVALSTLGMCCESLGRYEEAEAAFTRSLTLHPENIETTWDRALLRIGVGDFVRGFADYESRIERGKHTVFPAFKLPLWRGEPLKGKRVLVVAEQGHGDTMLLSRFVPLLAERASKVYLSVTLTMMQLVWEFRHLVEFIPDGMPLPEVDFYLHMASLPLWYGLGDNPPPADPGLIARRVDWQVNSMNVALPQMPEGDTLKIGICWTGNPIMERNDERSIPLKELARLAENPFVWLYSLQFGPAADQIAELGLDHLMVDLRPQMAERGYVGTGCLMRQLDLVITCCTSVAHLAGVLGVPCWVLLCADPYWIWGYNSGATSHWYPSVRLYRQKPGDSWAMMIDRVKNDLLDLRSQARLPAPVNENVTLESLQAEVDGLKEEVSQLLLAAE